jgi:uncharacterized protein YdaU (DUF1376 family)
MAEHPTMPLDIPALLGDTEHMTAEQFGAYCRLLFAMWLHGGQLVDNEAELQRIVKYSTHLWKKNRAVILRPMTRRNGVLTQKRLTATWLEVQDKRNKAIQSARYRWAGKR